jgi:hypothetical protein
LLGPETISTDWPAYFFMPLPVRRYLLPDTVSTNVYSPVESGFPLMHPVSVIVDGWSVFFEDEDVCWPAAACPPPRTRVTATIQAAIDLCICALLHVLYAHPHSKGIGQESEYT